MGTKDSEIVGWIFRCDLCGRDERIDVKFKDVAIRDVECRGWTIVDHLRGADRCPKCNRESAK